MSTILAIDPDTHNLGWCLIHDSGEVLEVGTVKAPKVKGSKGADVVRKMQQAIEAWELPGYDGLVVEGQELYYHHPRPDDIVRLSHVAAYTYGRLTLGLKPGRMWFPDPLVWKGSKPKAVMQARLYTELDLGYTLHGKGNASYASPKTVPHWGRGLASADWKHVGDAILLGQWALKQ